MASSSTKPTSPSAEVTRSDSEEGVKGTPAPQASPFTYPNLPPITPGLLEVIDTHWRPLSSRRSDSASSKAPSNLEEHQRYDIKKNKNDMTDEEKGYETRIADLEKRELYLRTKGIPRHHASTYCVKRAWTGKNTEKRNGSFIRRVEFLAERFEAFWPEVFEHVQENQVKKPRKMPAYNTRDPFDKQLKTVEQMERFLIWEIRYLDGSPDQYEIHYGEEVDEEPLPATLRTPRQSPSAYRNTRRLVGLVGSESQGQGKANPAGVDKTTLDGEIISDTSSDSGLAQESKAKKAKTSLEALSDESASQSQSSQLVPSFRTHSSPSPLARKPNEHTFAEAARLHGSDVSTQVGGEDRVERDGGEHGNQAETSDGEDGEYWQDEEYGQDDQDEEYEQDDEDGEDDEDEEDDQDGEDEQGDEDDEDDQDEEYEQDEEDEEYEECEEDEADEGEDDEVDEDED